MKCQAVGVLEGFNRMETLRSVGFLLSRLSRMAIQECHCGERPDRHHINHKDGNKTNNIPSNLEYLTPGDNNRHANRTGLNPMKGQHNPAAILTDEQVNEIRSRFCQGESRLALVAAFGMSKTEVYDILRGRIWTHLDVDLLRRAKVEHHKRPAGGHLSDVQVTEIRKLLQIPPPRSLTLIARMFDVTPTAIASIRDGKNHSKTANGTGGT